MEFIDLLKVGANKKEAAIAYNKISEPTIDYDGVNMNSMLVLFLICLGMLESDGSSESDDMFGDYNEGMFTLGKSAFDSTFGDVLHEGTYNFFTDTASIDEEILSDSESNSMISSLSVFGKGGVNLTARVVRHPYLEMMMGMMMGSVLGEGVNMSIYSIIPDDIFFNIMLKQLFLEYLSGVDSSSLVLLLSPPVGIPVIVMSGDMVNEQFGEESVVMYGMGLYTMLGSMSM